MKKILNIHIGDFGINFAEQFWESVGQEHKISPDGTIFEQSTERQKYVESMYDPIKKGEKYCSDAILLDLDPSRIDYLTSGPLGKIFNPANISYAKNGTGGLWARGHYVEGAEHVDQAMDIIRKRAEKADRIEAFQFFHSIYGGTGGGYGTLLLGKVAEEYHCIISSFVLVPSPDSYENPLWVYNSILSMMQLTMNTRMCFMFDNEALRNHASQSSDPKEREMNKLISDAVLGVSAPTRFGGLINASQSKIATNLVPYHYDHYFCLSQADIICKKSEVYKENLIIRPDIEELMFNPIYSLSSNNPRSGIIKTGCVISRGDISTYNVESQVKYAIQNNPKMFKHYLETPILISHSKVLPIFNPLSVTMISSQSSLLDTFRKWYIRFGAQSKRKAFMHYYAGYGIDQMEFIEAHADIDILIQDCQQKEIPQNDEEFD